MGSYCPNREGHQLSQLLSHIMAMMISPQNTILHIRMQLALASDVFQDTVPWNQKTELH